VRFIGAYAAFDRVKRTNCDQILLLDTDLMVAHYKSGGFDYIPEEGPLPVVQKFNSTTKNTVGVGVPCRAFDKVAPELQPFCFSFVDPRRPGWCAIARDGYIVFEPESAPTNPDTFDEDASLIIHNELFFTGFASVESLSHPNHFTRSKDGFLQLSEFEDTLEFKNSASSTIMRFDRKGELSSLPVTQSWRVTKYKYLVTILRYFFRTL